jgi:type IV secretion system protein TrbI
MSATLPPTPPRLPAGLPPPPRMVRKLRAGLLLGIGGVVLCAMAGVGVYGVTLLGEQHTTATKAPMPNSAAMGTTGLLAGLPTGGVILASAHVVIPPRKTPAVTGGPVSQTGPTGSATPAQTRPADDMTDAAIAGRRAAWAAYYQQLAQQQQDELGRRHAAMVADIDPQEAPAVPVAPTAPANGNGETAKQPKDFFEANASSPQTDYSPYTLTAPISPYELKATDIITAKLISGLNSDSPGMVKGIVTKNVLDHATGMHILIPQGSTLAGVYSTSVAYGQHRVMVAWQRVIFPPPCDQSLDLGAMPGADQTGQAGFQDLTDNHLGQVFTAAILVSLFGAAAQLSQPPSSAFQQYSPIQSAAGAVGQQTNQLGAEFARKGLSIPPTERIRQGYEFAIMVMKDIAFEHPWVAGVCDSNVVQVAAK